MSRMPGRVTAALLALGLAVAPPRAQAQDTSATGAVVPADTAPPRTLPVNGLLLRPQHLSYDMQVLFPDSTHDVGMRYVDVEHATYTFFPAWVIADTRTGSVAAVDSLYLSYVDLRPLHWTSILGDRSRMAIEFTPDSLYGGTSGPSGNQTIAMAHGRDLLAGSAMTEVVLQLMPHGVGEIDSVTVIEVDLGASRIVPGAVSVDGEQDLDTAVGRVHCWVISLTTPDGTVRYWLSESDPVVVRTRQELPHDPGVIFQQTLVERH
jgi:hypothetical protein